MILIKGTGRRSLTQVAAAGLVSSWCCERVRILKSRSFPTFLGTAESHNVIIRLLIQWRFSGRRQLEHELSETQEQRNIGPQRKYSLLTQFQVRRGPKKRRFRKSLLSSHIERNWPRNDLVRRFHDCVSLLAFSRSNLALAS